MFNTYTVTEKKINTNVLLVILHTIENKMKSDSLRSNTIVIYF